MRVLAYYPIHYGAEYLRESILSINDHVDKIIILYTPAPSYGFAGQMKCPETEDELRMIANEASNKIQWVSKTYHTEGHHRQEIFNHSDGYDLILAVDADEIWDRRDLSRCLTEAMESGVRRHGILGFVNFWKTFNHACYDGFAPIRITNPNISDGEVRLTGKVYHFSCCQSDEIMRYKWECHGHKNELRDDWWHLYESGALEDIHPVARGLWNAVKFDKTKLPKLLKDHARYNH